MVWHEPKGKYFFLLKLKEIYSLTQPKILYLITEDWFFYSHFFARAKAAKDAGYEVFVVTREGRHGSKIREAGITLIPVKLQRSTISPLSIIKELKSILQVYKEYRPDIVHHIALRPIIFGSICAYLSNIKHIINAPVGMGYVFISSSIKAKFLRPIISFSLRCFLKNNICILENSDDRGELIKRGLLSPDKAVLIEGSGVSLIDYKFVPRNNPRPKIMLAARMLKEKGIREFTEAAGIVNGAHERCDFFLVGGTDFGNPGSIPPNEIESWCEKNGVIWVGHSTEMQNTILDADIFCLPSYREGLPRSLLEAGASGCTIITTDVPGCRQLVSHMRTGLLVPPRDSLALAKAIKILLEAPDLRASLSSAMRCEIEEKYSEETINEHTLAVYENIRGGTRQNSKLRSQVSIIVPYYNQPEKLSKCLDSLETAISDGDEIIIVDDASLCALEMDFSQRPYVKYIRLSENQGPSAARNKGVAASSNELIAFMDADDIVLPERFSRQVAALKDNQEWVACVGGYTYLRKKQSSQITADKPQPPFDIRSELISGRIYSAGSVLMFRKSCFVELGGYNTSLRVYEDWDLLLRAIGAGTVGHCGSRVSVITASTRRSVKTVRAEALVMLERLYMPMLSPAEKKLFLHAVSYEKASALVRNGNYLKSLSSLALSFYKSPKRFISRVSGRLLLGTP